MWTVHAVILLNMSYWLGDIPEIVPRWEITSRVSKHTGRITVVVVRSWSQSRTACARSSSFAPR